MKQSTLESINDYIHHGKAPGGFITAVLANDLLEAFGKADDDNRRDLDEIVSYVSNSIPDNCHGSYEIVKDWLKMHAERAEARRREA